MEHLLGKRITLIVPSDGAAKARRAVKCFGAKRARLVRPQIGFDDFSFGMLERLLHLRSIIKTQKNLLVPKTQLGTLQIIFERRLRIAEVAIALSKVEFVARNQKGIAFMSERMQERFRIILEFSNIGTARAVPHFLNVKARCHTSCAIVGTFTVFMKDAFVGNIDPVVG